jgi:hypothetical protein
LDTFPETTIRFLAAITCAEPALSNANLPETKVKEGTPETIAEAVRQAIEIAAPGGGFILGTSDSIRDGTPDENVRAYFAAAHKYGARSA